MVLINSLINHAIYLRIFGMDYFLHLVNTHLIATFFFCLLRDDPHFVHKMSKGAEATFTVHTLSS